MTYKCLDCGHLFEEGEQATWEESRGEFWGIPVKEKMSGCPLCHGSYEQTVPCEHCGSMHLEDELVDGWCEDCIEEHRHDIKACYKVGEEDTAMVPLNGFLATMFKESEINEILMEALRDVNKYIGVDCLPYIKRDKEAFVQALREEVEEDGKD